MTQLCGIETSVPQSARKRIVIEVLDNRPGAGAEMLRQAGARRKIRTVPFQETFVVLRDDGEVDTVLLDLEELSGIPPLSLLRIATSQD